MSKPSKPRPSPGQSGQSRDQSAGGRERERLAAAQAAARRRERKVLIAVLVGVVVLVVGGGLALQAWRTQRAPSAVPSSAGSLAPVSIEPGRPITFGKPNAPVTVDLYEDFHCPHCADFEEEFGPTLSAAQREGRVEVALHPMAFIDEGSTAASNAMACAAEAGFGEAYYRGLFANHTLSWSDKQLLDLAAKVGGSATDDFSTCVTTRKHAEWVDSINAAADRAGVSGTPTMFIDGKPVDIASLTVAALEEMLAPAGSR